MAGGRAVRAAGRRDCGAAAGRVVSATRRLYLDRPSVTIRTEFFKPEKGRYLHPTEDRVITHYEAAMIQGFPVNYQWVGTREEIARQIGNAVPIPLGQAIGQQLSKAFDASLEAMADTQASRAA